MKPVTVYNMNTITIAFSSTKNKFMLFGKLIEAVEKRPFSHALVIHKDPITGIDMVFQSSHGMVHHCTLQRFLTTNHLVKSYDLTLNTSEYNVFYSSMLNCLGTRYGWLELVGIALNKLIHIRSPFRDGLQTMICSELAARVCQIKGIQIDKDLDSVTPSDLEAILRRIYGENK